MKLALILATVLIQYFDPPPRWPYEDGCYNGVCPRWQPDRFAPRYETDAELCIRTGYCLDPRRPHVPPFRDQRREYNWGE